MYQNKGPHLNTVEWFYIHKEASSDSQLHDKQIFFPNKMLGAVLKIGT